MRVSTFRVLSTSRLGYRGGFLAILAVVNILYGWSLVDPTAEQLASASYQWRSIYAPPWAWGGMWILVGIIAMVSAFLPHDGAGYGAAIGWDVLWALIALASTIAGDVPRGWVSTIIWGAAAGWAALCSSWPEPVKIRTVTAINVQTMELSGDGDE